jgi:hypothetical protein
MDAIITYSLRDGQTRSDQYYRDVVAFTDKVLAEARDRAQPLVEAFQSYLEKTGLETPRTFSEYAFELLTLGVLWRVYAGDALGLAQAPRRTLTALVRLRQRGGCLKPSADFLRGVLGSLFLSPDGRHPPEMPTPTLGHLDRLQDWLAASDVFTQELKRLRAWRDFLAIQPLEEATENLAAAISFAAWFDERGETILGRYTPHVERFLAETHPGYRWREDAIFCGRRRAEYHLNMVGTEILNRAFRESFLDATRKVVILPPCMRARPDGECQARPTPFGDLCASCTPGCRVRQLTALGRERGFEILIMPHELSVFSSGVVEPVKGNAVGIVGVSCVLTNPSGGWETKGLGIPAQGVLLDYCGCSWHWHEEGIPTDINDGQLLKVLGIGKNESLEVKYGKRGEATLQPR